ncbi:hypothetical protein [Microbacterium sp.]|uniref:hypothetical protein n=1 Tax=Microbacterium sp. TaxID=51671 RepID=UPI0028123C81|nr:hypothetical protein [Microbacterium sp.]
MLYIPSLLRRDDLGTVRRRTGGYRASAIEGDLVRVRPGVFALGEEWQRARPEGLVVARARALTLTASEPPVFSHETAAAIHALPLFRPDPLRVHISLDSRRPGACTGTVRHRAELRDDEVVEVDGLRVTSLSRTVADVARTASRERAVVVADAALRRAAGGPQQDDYDLEEAAAFCAVVRTIANRSAHGSARAERVLAFADGRAQLPGESISRIRLVQLGFHGIRLQVRVPGPNGDPYFVDFGGDGDDGFWLGEFDGRTKYADADMRRGRSPARVVEAEKFREDWIRGVTRAPMARWGWTHIDTPEALGTRLRAFGIRPPR